MSRSYIQKWGSAFAAESTNVERRKNVSADRAITRDRLSDELSRDFVRARVRKQKGRKKKKEEKEERKKKELCSVDWKTRGRNAG